MTHTTQTPAHSGRPSVKRPDSSQRRFAVIGEMLELGDSTRASPWNLPLLDAYDRVWLYGRVWEQIEPNLLPGHATTFKDVRPAGGASIQLGRKMCSW